MNMKDSKEVIRILKEMQGYDYGFPAWNEVWALRFAVECIESHAEEIKKQKYISG